MGDFEWEDLDADLRIRMLPGQCVEWGEFHIRLHMSTGNGDHIFSIYTHLNNHARQGGACTSVKLFAWAEMKDLSCRMERGSFFCREATRKKMREKRNILLERRQASASAPSSREGDEVECARHSASNSPPHRGGRLAKGGVAYV